MWFKEWGYRILQHDHVDQSCIGGVLDHVGRFKLYVRVLAMIP